MDEVKKRTKTVISEGSTDALLGKDDLMTRSYNGRLTKTILPDETIICSYKEKKCTDEEEKFTFNTVTIVHRQDGTVFRINQDGDICFLTSKERLRKNTEGSNELFGQDYDYLFDINGNPPDRKNGSYTCDLSKGELWTVDDEGNYFKIDVNSNSESKLAVTLEGLDGDHRPSTPVIPEEEEEFIDEELQFLSAPK